MASSSREIERKFLVRKLPADLPQYGKREIEQGYLATKRNGTQVRLRKAGLKCTLTCKRGAGVTREEWETELTAQQFETLWPATSGRRLRKTRYDIPYGAFTIELDVYGGTNQGLVVAEVEFRNEKECFEFEPPDWLGRDVSGKPRYSNVRLARE